MGFDVTALFILSCVSVCVWGRVCVCEGGDRVLYHQILAPVSLCITYLFTTLFSRTSPRHFFSLPPTSLSPFSLTHIHSSLSSLSPLSVSGWRPSGSGTVIYVVWLFALNGMFYSVVGGSHWLCCRSPEPCIKKYVTHTHTYTHTHTV